MPDGRGAVLVSLAIYNVIQNKAIPERHYVRANLLATLALVTLARRHGCTLGDLGLAPRQWRYGLISGAKAGLASLAVLIAAASHPVLRGYLRDARAAGHDRRSILYRAVIRFPLGTALFEEVAFRGVVYAMWRRAGATPLRASAVTAMAFASWHFLPAARALVGNPLQERLSTRRAHVGVVAAGAVVTGLASLVLTWLRVRSSSVVAPWLLHASVNSTGFLAGVNSWRSQP